jgi:hypothetical protein
MAENARHGRVTVAILSGKQVAEQPYRVPGTPAERLALVWPLTVEVCALGGEFDAESGLQRSAVRVLPPSG